MRLRVALLSAASLAASLAGVARAADADRSASLEYFEKKVRPLLVDNCYNCHSANTNAKGGLRVDDRNGLLKGGDKGPAIVPGHPEQSLLIKAVQQTGDVKMPPKKQLSEEQIQTLTAWIKDGAAWPEVRLTSNLQPGYRNPVYDKLKKEHWAWQQLSKPPVPEVKDRSWARDDIDRFILAKLESKNLKPVGDADKVSLLRRVTFDLTGLPPTPEQIAAFTADQSADAFEKVVDRLLASPAFGERFGRHWLDVARYGESTAGSRNIPYPHAWRYRDWVIDAFNSDKPFNQFLREQVAGDLLPVDSQQQRDQNLVATAFLAIGVKDVNQRFKVRFQMDNVDEQIDTLSRSVLALTASCARCHDHKFDPIPQSDYYSLAGIFTSTDDCAGVRNKMGGGGLDYYDSSMLIPIGSPGEGSNIDPQKVAELKKELDKARAEWNAIRGTPAGTEKGPDGFPKQRPYRLKFEKLQAEYAAFSDPAVTGKVTFGLRDAKTIGDTEIRVRGEAEQLGPVVPRGFLSLANVPDAPKVNPQQSGRLELAKWLTSPQNPLTSRVAVNRVWHYLFGQGIVKSVDNFGVTGDTPSHPELLDYLASRFISEGWSTKKLVRELVLSRTYRLGADSSPANIAADPQGRLFWRHSPRRLEAEEIRDATLAASGNLKFDRPEGSPANQLKVIEVRNNGPEAVRYAKLAQENTNRSVYLLLLRGWVPISLEVFDFAEQGLVTGSRDATTVAPQALYLLNDPFVRKQTIALAERVLAKKELNERQRIEQVYLLTVGRPPTAKEADRAKAYVADFEVAAKDVIASSGKTGVAEASLPAERTEAQPAAALVPAGGKGKKNKKVQQAQSIDQAIAAAKSPKPATQPAEAAIAVADATGTNGGGGATAVLPPNPDEADQTDTRGPEEVIQAADAKTAAWASLAQALIGSAEFRYLK